MSCHRVIDRQWETCRLFLWIPHQRSLITLPLNCCRPQCDMHHVCGENGFLPPGCPHCTVSLHTMSSDQNALSSKWRDAASGSKPLVIHVFTYLLTLTHSLKWVWFWLMNHRVWTDLLFNQCLGTLCMSKIHANSLCIPTVNTLKHQEKQIWLAF